MISCPCSIVADFTSDKSARYSRSIESGLHLSALFQPDQDWGCLLPEYSFLASVAVGFYMIFAVWEEGKRIIFGIRHKGFVFGVAIFLETGPLPFNIVIWLRDELYTDFVYIFYFYCICRFIKFTINFNKFTAEKLHIVIQLP